MSDIFKKDYNFERFKHDVVVDTSHCLKYVNRQCVSSEEVAFTVHTTNEVLKSWQDFKEKGTVLPFRYIDILNCFLSENHAVLVRKDCNRIEEVLRKVCSRVKANFKGKVGRNYVKFASQSKRIAIRRGELLTAAELERELYELGAAKKAVEEDNKKLHERSEELYERLVEAHRLRKQADEGLTDANAHIEKLQNENSNLWQYFDKLTELEGFKNCGKPVLELKDRQKRRKIRELKTYVEQALWFSQTFGLQLSSVTFKDGSGRSHEIDYENQDGRKTPYNDLSKEEKEKVQQVLFLMDSFCVSEAAYHELTMVDGGENLPRSYLVKQCKTNLNSLCHITRTPGEEEGAQLDFMSELQNAIRKKASFVIFNPVCTTCYRNQFFCNLHLLCSVL